MRGALRGLYDWIELRPLNGASIARWSGLKGPLCRRVVAAVRHAGEPAELARILPGTEGLSLFVDALAARGCPPDRVVEAREAIRAFADLLHHGGGSQRRLIAAVERALGTSGRSATGGATAHAQLRLWEAARDLTGSSLEALLAISIVHRSTADERELDSISALGQLGYTARPDASPLMAKHYAPQHVVDDEAAAGPGSAGPLHDRFGTPGLTVSRSRIDAARVLTTYEGTGDQPIDVWTGPVTNRGVHVIAPGPQNSYSSFAAVRTPTRRLVLDLWVERPLAQRSVLRAGAYRATPDRLADADCDDWYDRLPGDPPVVLPTQRPWSGLEQVYPNHGAVLSQCFEFAGRTTEDFVCYRCAVDYPIWMSIYRLTLEFAD